MGPSSSCSSKEALEKDILCRVCRVVEYQFHHYGAYACNRCRAFFRRMVRRQRKGCPPTPCITTKAVPEGSNGPICDISLFRGACQACRFLACLHEGMNPALVLTDEVRSSRYSKPGMPIQKQLPKRKTRSQTRATRKTEIKTATTTAVFAPNSRLQQCNTSTLSSFRASSLKFYFDSPVIVAPWAKDIQSPMFWQQHTSFRGESSPIRVDYADNDDDYDEEGPLVVDDSDPIIGSVADGRDIPERRGSVYGSGMWDDQRNSDTDHYNLETLYRWMDEEHNSNIEIDQEKKAVRSGDRGDSRGGIQTPSFEALTPSNYEEQPTSIENNVLNFSFSVPDMEDSPLLIDMLEN